MPSVYVTGPVGIFVSGSGGAGGPQQLGVCENGIQISVTPEYDGVMSDIAGTRIPLDLIFMGVQGSVGGTLTVFSWTLFEMLAKVPFTGTSSAGLTQFGEIGTLMTIENAAPQIWVKFPYSQKGVFGDMVPGYHFYAALLNNNQIMANSGATKIPIAFRCIRKYFASSANNVAAGSFLLYDHSMTGIVFP